MIQGLRGGGGRVVRMGPAYGEVAIDLGRRVVAGDDVHVGVEGDIGEAEFGGMGVGGFLDLHLAGGGKKLDAGNFTITVLVAGDTVHDGTKDLGGHGGGQEKDLGKSHCE